MTHDEPYSALRRPLHTILWLGLLAGLATAEVSAAPPAPVAPITSAANRFTDNANGTVTDGQTGLIWLKDAQCFNPNTWIQALVLANQLASPEVACGLDDSSTAGQWRLPNRNELQSLIDYTTYDPALPPSHPFLKVDFDEGDGQFWTSTTYATNVSQAWIVEVFYGHSWAEGKDEFRYIWPVRDGQ